MARKKSIQKEGLVSNKPKAYRKIQKFDWRIYLTSDLESARRYAAKTVMIEKRLTPEERKFHQKFGLDKHKNVGIVLQVNIKNLEIWDGTKPNSGHIVGLYVDPESTEGSWYIYSGKKIPALLIHILEEIPLSAVNKKWLKEVELDDVIATARENVDHIKYTAGIIEYSKLIIDNEDEQKQYLLKNQLDLLQHQLRVLTPEQKKKYTNFYSLVKAELENKGYVDKN